MVDYCYVEPSCRCPVSDPSFTAFLHKHGPLVVDGQSHVVRAFDGACSAIPDQAGPHVHRSSCSCGEMLGGVEIVEAGDLSGKSHNIQEEKVVNVGM